MKSEEEIMFLLLDVAKKDERIRAVLLIGSRANPTSKKDRFQDFDIIYIVDKLGSFLDDPSWIDIFGERIILQKPDQMDIVKGQSNNPSFTWLMLLKDKNRIDLTLFPIDKIESEFEPGSLAVSLIDKDKLFLNLPAPGDTDYLSRPPNEKSFTDCCNEFWWVCTYVAKGLWRNEITYAKDMLEKPVRDMFLKMIEWHIGIETGFTISFGKSGKNMKPHLSRGLYKRILLTYPNAKPGKIWKSLFIMTEIFSDLAKKNAAELNFTYNLDEENKVKKYLKWAYSLEKKNDA
jgi:aminoglycoside 6-adenylyltransferase